MVINLRVLAIVLVAELLTGCSFPDVASGRDTASQIRPELEVLTGAQDVGFDYLGNLRRAEKGETKAIVALINFSPQVDAAASLAHGWVLLDLQKITGREKFANSLAHATRNGRKSAVSDMEVAGTYR
jgi:hypothetical protein